MPEMPETTFSPLPSYEALAALVSAHMTRGVLANTMVSRAAYEPAIAQGALLAQETPAGLLLLQQREEHHRLTFFLHDTTVPLGVVFPAPTVTEVAFRPRDVGLQAAVQYLQTQGFSPLLNRLRMSRPAGEGPRDAPGVFPGEVAQRAAVAAFLRENFSALTGCLPNEAELTEALRQGQVLLSQNETGLTGLLHFSFDGKSGEIRHLAIRADQRGRGLTRPLIAAFLQRIQSGKSTVWLRDPYPAAQAAYTALGFTPDSRRSVVLAVDPHHQRLPP